MDHVDLKNVCTMMRDVQTAFAGQTISIDNKMYETACGAGADVRSVWYRASMLGMLRMWPESPLTPWTHDGQLDDVVFKVAATFPMKKMEVGVVQQGPPFDVKEFLKQIGEASGEQE